jgi:PAS domain S-box-containing protein
MPRDILVKRDMRQDLEQRMQERTLELEVANETLRGIIGGLARQLDAVRRFRRVATQLIYARGLELLCEQILDTAVALLHPGSASIQMFHPERGSKGEFRLTGHRGFSAETARRWECVVPAERTTCGEVLRTGKRVALRDVRECDFLAGSDELQAYLDAGIQAVQTTPLFSKSGALLGMVSTHWPEPHELSPRESHALNVLARLAADSIERVRSQDAPRASQQRLASIYDTLSDVIFHLAVGPEHQFRFISVNAAFLRVTGLGREAVVGKTVEEVIPEPSLTMVLGKYQQAIAERTTVLWEETSDYPTGRLTGEVSVTPVFDSTGKCTHLIGSVHDITERKRSETALRDSEERFRNMAERQREGEVQLASAQRLAMVGSFEWNIERNVMKWSEETLRILGLPEEPSSLAACLNCVHPKDRQKFLEIERQVASSDTPVEVEYRIVRPGGEVRIVRSIAEGIKNDRGALVRVVGASQDITDQVEARDRLLESEQRLKSAQELAHVGSWHWDLEANQVSCSEECIRIFGQPEDYKPSFEALLTMITPRDSERVAREITAAIAGKIGYSTEFQIVRPDGELRTIAFASRVLLSAEDLPRHIFGACQDVTETRRGQEEALARQKLETVGTLANGIAHDFNNILGGVLAQADLALTELDSGSFPKAELKAIRDVAMRGAEIVRELLTYAGTESPALVPLDVSQVVEEMLGLLKVSVSKHARIETDLARDLPAVRANAAQISQLVMNLVTNASDAIGDRSGIIRVITRRVTVRSAAAERRSSSEADYLQLEVSDTGRGMTPETQAKVFEPFFSTKSTGRGIGLAVVDGIVRSLGGTIQLESELGRGTTIRISLPAAESDYKASGGTRFDGEEPRQSTVTTVLVVEDEAPLRQAVSKMLARSGVFVIEAPDGASALDAIRTHEDRIDILILDITIPGASSREIFEEALRLRPEVRVIVTSAYSEDVAEESLRGPIQHFLRKPYRLGDLAVLIQTG